MTTEERLAITETKININQERVKDLYELQHNTNAQILAMTELYHKSQLDTQDLKSDIKEVLNTYKVVLKKLEAKEAVTTENSKQVKSLATKVNMICWVIAIILIPVSMALIKR